MTLGHPSAAASDKRATTKTRLRLAPLAAAAASLTLLAGCALTPAVAGPAPSHTPSAGASASASPSVAPSTSVSTSPSATPSPTPTKTTPPDPLAGLSKKRRATFKACMKQTVRPGSSGTCTKLVLKELKAAGFYPWGSASYVSSTRGANAILNYQRSRGLDADAVRGRTMLGADFEDDAQTEADHG